MRDSAVKCQKCGRKEAVSMAACLRAGWPVCCGSTMLLVEVPSPEKIDAAVVEAYGPAAALRKAAAR